MIGEAVQLELRPAGFATRAMSGAIDLLVQGLTLTVLLVVSFRVAAGLDAAASAALVLTLVVLVAVGLPTVIESLSRGRTLGKVIFGLRTVRDDAGPIRFRHALIRALVGFVEIWLLFGAPALISSLASPTGKRLGDLVAGTYVVRERGSVRAAPMAQVAPELAAWARHADIARLPDGMALSVRQFLARAPGCMRPPGPSWACSWPGRSRRTSPRPRPRAPIPRRSLPPSWPSADAGTSSAWPVSRRLASAWRASTRLRRPWPRSAAASTGGVRLSSGSGRPCTGRRRPPRGIRPAPW